jgi:hypothetical protein
MASIRALKIEAFCKNFEDLLNDLSGLQPGDPTLMMVKLYFKGAVMTDPEEIVTQTMESLSEFRVQILNKDEQFFLGDLEKHIDTSDSTVSQEINRIRELWVNPETTMRTKNAIWTYMINFIKLGESIQGKKKNKK